MSGDSCLAGLIVPVTPYVDEPRPPISPQPCAGMLSAFIAIADLMKSDEQMARRACAGVRASMC